MDPDSEQLKSSLSPTPEDPPFKPQPWLRPMYLVQRLPHPHCESAVLKGALQAWKQQLCLPIVGPTVASFCHRRLNFGDKTAPANVGADGRHMNLTEEAIYQICPISPCCVNPHVKSDSPSSESKLSNSLRLAARTLPELLFSLPGGHSCDVTRAAELRIPFGTRFSERPLTKC
ncbi:hypothetical protein CISG_05510 [Coccidioides immitis RMSCC 3703]|uniref:Uncharacterized protein n=2 Tax=Coccidioides immitis TaxID=5501 RepID=A0A0J8TR02_COCIT|nr:hypothetical protein CIRG_02737 [Coccidioides immitis RMSCC 2394]KMU76142.1 hypothetical protein CISG_05510 [Coccidioides immitis RMSCC 3703]